MPQNRSKQERNGDRTKNGNDSPKPVRAVYRLVQEPASPDTIEALEILARLARGGEIVGIAYAVMLKGRRVLVNTTGEAHRSPIFARGMVALLDDALAEMVQEGHTED
jgi:hypothetical protein